MSEILRATAGLEDFVRSPTRRFARRSVRLFYFKHSAQYIVVPGDDRGRKNMPFWDEQEGDNTVETEMDAESLLISAASASIVIF